MSIVRLLLPPLRQHNGIKRFHQIIEVHVQYLDFNGALRTPVADSHARRVEGDGFGLAVFRVGGDDFYYGEGGGEG